MDTALERVIEYVAKTHELPIDLIKAVVQVESSWNPWATRFEPGWKYFLDPFRYKWGTNEMTERVHQQTSWGLMQIMGTVARELGYQGSLPRLCDPQLGLELGAKKLQASIKRYGNVGGIQAYNAGKPGTDKGKEYHAKVMLALADITGQRVIR